MAEDMGIVDDIPVVFETLNQFDTMDEAREFFDAIIIVDHRCIGTIMPIRTIEENEEDAETYAVPICARGPSVADWERRLLVDCSEDERYAMIIDPGTGDVRISDTYKRFTSDLISLFMRLEPTIISVGAEIKDVRLSTPLRMEEGYVGQQIVCTKFKIVPLDAENRLRKHWGSLSKILKGINNTLGIRCSSLEMNALLQQIETGNVTNEIFRLPIFLTHKEKVAFINNLWGDMKQNPTHAFYDPSFEPAIEDFIAGKMKSMHLSTMVIKEDFDSDVRRKRRAANQVNQGSQPNRPNADEDRLFQMVCTLRHSDEHFERMRKGLPLSAGNEAFPLRNVEDFYVLVEYATPSLMQRLVTQYPHYLEPKEDYPE